MDDVDWTASMRRRSDHDLLRVASEDGFEPAAVEAAQVELARRGLSANRVMEVQADLEHLRAMEAARADQSLSGAGRLAFVFLGFLLFWAVIAAIILRSRGYQRKSREAFICIDLSFLFWGAISLILAFGFA